MKYPEDAPRNIAFERWRPPIQMATTLGDLMLVVAAYQSGWRVADLLHIPVGLADPIRSPQELSNRAVELRRADLDGGLTDQDKPYVRELAATIEFAAQRARFLEAKIMQSNPVR